MIDVKSPEYIKYLYTACENTFVTKYQKYSNHFSDLLLMILIVYLSYCLNAALMTSLKLSEGFGLFLAKVTLNGILFIAPFSYLVMRVPQRLHFFFFISCTLFIWIFSFKSYLPPHYTSLDFWLFLMYMPVILISAFVFHRIDIKNNRVKAALLFSLFFWTTTYTVTYLIFKNNFQFFLEIWDLKLFHLWAFLTLSRFQRKNVSSKSNFEIFNPINAFKGVLWPSDLERETECFELKRLWANGVFNLMFGYSLIYLRFIVEMSVSIGPDELMRRNLLLSYYAIVTTIGLHNLIIGMARLLGYRAPDISEFPLLAKKPGEFWRTVSTYNYHYALKFLFFPILRVTKSPLLASIVAFFNTYINHNGFFVFFELIAFALGIQSSLMTKNIGFLYFSIIFFFIQFFTMYASHFFWPISKDQLEKSHWAWISIILTQILKISGAVVTSLIVSFIFSFH